MWHRISSSFPGFNPKYKKEDQKRMRYIQLKYAQAYGDQGVESPDVVIHRIGRVCHFLLFT